MREENVDGKLSYGDFYQKMLFKHCHEGCHISKITFLDSIAHNDIVQNNVEQSNGAHSSVISSYEYQKNKSKEASSDVVPDAGELEYKVASMVNSPLGCSIWEKKYAYMGNSSGDGLSSHSSSFLYPSSSSSKSYPFADIEKRRKRANSRSSGTGVLTSQQSVWSTAMFGTQKSGDILNHKMRLPIFF